MANTLSSVIPLIFAQGLNALRSNSVLPRLVNNDFGTEVKEKGEVINIPIPSTMTSTAVVPGPVAPDPAGVTPRAAQIPLDYWEESAFTLTEKEVAQVVAGVVPIQLSAAVESLATSINASLMGLYTNVYSIVGTPGTTPFASDLTGITKARRTLGLNKAPLNNRRFVMNPDAEANALALPAFYGALYSGTTSMVDEGKIGHKFGFDWAMDQQIPTQTAGTLTGTVTANGAQTAGQGSINNGQQGTVSIATASGAAFAPNVGDIISFAGSPQTYTILGGSALGASTNGVFNIAPALVSNLASGAVVTLTASHVVNLAFHRDAFAFASRPLKGDILSNEADESFQIPDPISGINMRLTYRKEFHRTRMAFDVLWGVSSVRPELAVRVAG